MQFRRSGIPDPNALEIPREIQPISFAKRSPLKRLNSLLTHIWNLYPKAYSEYTRNLQHQYDSLVNRDIIAEKSIDISKITVEFDHLRENPNLASSSLNYFLQVLQPPEDTDLVCDAIEVTQRNQLRSVLCPKYQNILVLAETIGREDAIEVYKTYHDNFARGGQSSQANQCETLEDFAARWNPESAKANPGLIRVISNVVDGKLYLRKDNCLWNDAIQDLEDSELKYYICCYGDFNAPRQANSNFVLTMERTIIEGYPFCDSVFHDLRINNNLAHPSEEFFFNMNPD